ncbi:MAG: hypothetical protein K9L28_03040 [Synergistales bacterium]|nr:hypothetical protein [Synergistales bacterium]
MTPQEQQLRTALNLLAQQSGLVEEARERFLASIPQRGIPSAEERRQATQEAERVLRNGVLSILQEQEILHPDEATALRIRQSLSVLVPPPEQIALPLQSRLRISALAAATGLGALAGGAGGSSLTGLAGLERAVLSPWSVGAGAVCGAALSGVVAHSRAIRRTLCAIAGTATVAELWQMLPLPGRGLLRALWGMVGLRPESAGSRLKRIALYLLAIGFVLLSREEQQLNRKDLGSLLHRYFLNRLRLLGCAVIALEGAAEPQRTVEECPRPLIRAVYGLHHAHRNQLETASHEVIEEARALGYQGLDGAHGFSVGEDSPSGATVRWSEALRERYDTFGVVEEGQPIVIEEEPIEKDGVLLQRGLVRRRRENGHER